MLRQLIEADQSKSAPQSNEKKQENQDPARPPADKIWRARSSSRPQKDDGDEEEFVPISHDDVQDKGDEASDDKDGDGDTKMENMLRPFLGLRALRKPPSRGETNKFDDLHPFTSALTVSNVDDCVALEDTAFPVHERCSREKVRQCYESRFCAMTAATGFQTFYIRKF